MYIVLYPKSEKNLLESIKNSNLKHCNPNEYKRQDDCVFVHVWLSITKEQTYGSYPRISIPIIYCITREFVLRIKYPPANALSHVLPDEHSTSHPYSFK